MYSIDKKAEMYIKGIQDFGIAYFFRQKIQYTSNRVEREKKEEHKDGKFKRRGRKTGIFTCD